MVAAMMAGWAAMMGEGTLSPPVVEVAEEAELVMVEMEAEREAAARREHVCRGATPEARPRQRPRMARVVSSRPPRAARARASAAAAATRRRAATVAWVVVVVPAEAAAASAGWPVAASA